MAKPADSPYASGRRTADWLKVKTAQRQEVVIAGFTAPRQTRSFFGALVLAVREGDAWRYIGHVGTGFSHQVLEELHGKLVRLKTSKSPFCQSALDWDPRIAASTSVTLMVPFLLHHVEDVTDQVGS